jgi:spore maturation protein CgeB
VTAESLKEERVLVAGDPIRGYMRSISAAFQACGVTSVPLEWQTPRLSPLEYWKRILSNRYSEKQKRNSRRDNSLAFERAIAKVKPDYAIVVNGVALTDAAKEECRKNGTKLVHWACDSPVWSPWILEQAKGFDLIYTYEPDDVELFSSLGPTSCLPLGYDDRIYQPTSPSQSKEIDLCFVGAINRAWPERTELLQEVASELKGGNVAIWSDTIRYYSPSRLLDLLIIGAGRNLRIRRKEASHEEINSLYNRSKICLNIHHQQSRGALNPRTFEILGSGGFLLTDRTLDGVSGFESGRDYWLYSDSESLIKSMREFLGDGDKRERIASHGHEIVARHHTYVARASKILKDLRDLG